MCVQVKRRCLCCLNVTMHTVNAELCQKVNILEQGPRPEFGLSWYSLCGALRMSVVGPLAVHLPGHPAPLGHPSHQQQQQQPHPENYIIVHIHKHIQTKSCWL